MSPQDLHIIDIALEVLMAKGENRELKNAIYECMRCFHSDEVWGEPYHDVMLDHALFNLNKILMVLGFGSPIIDREDDQ